MGWEGFSGVCQNPFQRGLRLGVRFGVQGLGFAESSGDDESAKGGGERGGEGRGAGVGEGACSRLFMCSCSRLQLALKISRFVTGGGEEAEGGGSGRHLLPPLERDVHRAMVEPHRYSTSVVHVREVGFELRGLGSEGVRALDALQPRRRQLVPGVAPRRWFRRRRRSWRSAHGAAPHIAPRRRARRPS